MPSETHVSTPHENAADAVKTIQLHAQQQLALQCWASKEYDQILYGGAVGGGKTVLMTSLAVIAGAAVYPGDGFLLMRYDLTMCQRELFDRFRKCVYDVFGGDYFIEEDKKGPQPYLKFRNGSRFQGVSGKDEAKFWGMELRGAFIDEAHEIPERIYPKLMTRFRSSRADLDNYHFLFMCTNPAPGYLHDKFVRDRETAMRERRLFVPCLPRDNPFISDIEGFHRRGQSTMTAAEYRRYFEGDWSTFEGVFYPDFDRTVHVREFELDPTISYHMVQAGDWGFVNPAVILFIAVDPNQGIFIFDEIAVTYTPAKKLAEMYFERCDRWRIPKDKRLVAMDPQAKAQIGGADVPWTEMEEAGMPLVPAFKRDLGRGKNAITQALIDRSLFIHPRCERLVWEFPRAQYARTTQTVLLHRSKPEGMLDKDNDALDALRYGFNFLQAGEAIPHDIDPNSAAHITNRMMRQRLVDIGMQRERGDWGGVVQNGDWYGG